ncbi:hypothetical protein ACH427_23450 [Streptomyces sp. NPDC020379]|uniref:hypothetical protein n=1 Tax=Streptomyces sp. NPDC020379 TaxID=3365071 RepID=UPI00378DA0D7
MPRLLPLIVIGVCVFLWFRSRKRAAAARTGQVTAPKPPSDGLSKEAARLGFLPESRQNTDRSMPDPELEALRASVARGEWEPAAAFLAATGRDWERRSAVIIDLADAASEEDGWLTAWETARPDDPDAAAVRAKSTVFLAWQLRGSHVAKETSREQFEGFHRVLSRSRDDIARAAELNPEDPSPYITEIWTGLGLGYPHERMHELWAQITARAPFHYEAHYSALQYWCAKWRGSEELAHDFAARAAAGAPAGTLLPALRLVALFEHQEYPLRVRAYRTPEARAMVDAVLADLPAVPPTHPRLAEVRHLLAFFLVQQQRHAEALEQFRHVDGHVGANPWSLFGDTAKLYCRFRERAIDGAS